MAFRGCSNGMHYAVLGKIHHRYTGKKGVYCGERVAFATSWREEKRVDPCTGETKTTLKAYKGESIPTPVETAPALISP